MLRRFQPFAGPQSSRGDLEDLRRYQLHLVASGAGTPTINHTVTALRFLFIVTLRKPDDDIAGDLLRPSGREGHRTAEGALAR
jgi:hypothetical protein